MTTHELARRLLEGPDQEILNGPPEIRHDVRAWIVQAGTQTVHIEKDAPPAWYDVEMSKRGIPDGIFTEIA